MLFIEAMLLALSCSLDAFAASFAYGTKKIKIPFNSNIVISIISSGMLGVSLWLGAAVRKFIPPWLTVSAAFAILFLIGLSKLLDSMVKTLVRKHVNKNGKGIRKHMRFSMFDVKFIFSVIADPEEADINQNKIISPAEASALAVSLSLDGLAVGFGAAIGYANIPVVLAASLVMNILAVTAGGISGRKLKLPFNISWIGGVMLMGLAAWKLF